LRAYGDLDYGGSTSNMLWFNFIYPEANYIVRCEALTERIIGGDRVDELGIFE